MSSSKRGVSKGEIADAYKRFKGHEFETPVQRFELEDKPTPQEQKENLADLILKQRDEITTLRQQLEQAEARVAEYQKSITAFVAENERLQAELVQVEDISPSAILRKQAEAVEKCETALSQIPGAMLWDMDQVQSWLAGEAQRLRNQADELEKAGGEP